LQAYDELAVEAAVGEHFTAENSPNRLAVEMEG